MNTENFTITNKKTFKIIASVLVALLFLIQVFPPLWTNDVTSLRHFFLALFDIMAVVFLLFSFKKGGQKLNAINVVSILLLLWMYISSFWAINRSESIVVANRWLLVFSASFLFGTMLLKERKLMKVVVISAMVVALVNVLTCIISYYHLDCASYPKRIPSINGGYGNKNIFAACLLMKLPFLYYALFRYKKVFKIISAILIFAVCFCLPILSARSTYLGIILQIVLLVAFVVVLFFKDKNKKYILKSLLIIACVVLGFVSGGKFVTYNYNHGEHKQKNEFDVSQRIKETGTGKSSKVRKIIWKNTLEIIKEKPLCGWGVGNHKIAIMKVETKQKGNFIVSDHAHNDFIEMTSELGIVGLLLYLGLYLTIFYYGVLIIFSPGIKNPFKVLAFCSLLLLAVYFNDALFNFPNERAVMQIYLAISIALMSFACRGLNKEEGTTNKKFIIVLLVLLIPATVVEGMHFKSSKMQLDRIVCYNSKNKAQIPAKYWLDNFPKLPNIDESTKPIALSVANMFAMEKNYRQAIDILLPDNSNPYLAMKELTLASWYSKINKPDSAVYFADKCLAMKPKLYNAAVVKLNIAKKAHERDLAKKILTDFIANNDSLNYRPWCDLMNLYIEEENYSYAMEIWEKAHATVPKSKKIFDMKEKIETVEEENKENK